jgi:hypothetical protein
MRRVRRVSGWLAGLVVVSQAVAGSAAAQVYIYPEKGQSPQQQARDQNECQGWAMQQTGYNPGAPPPPPPTSSGPTGDVVRGAGRGAALGAVGGAIGGDAGKGAAIGAATGALFGTMRRADRARSEQAQQQAYSAQAAQAQTAFNRALAACLSARGYTVR